MIEQNRLLQEIQKKVEIYDSSIEQIFKEKTIQKKPRPPYTLHDFLKYDTEEFIHNIYTLLLQREAKPQDLQEELELLNSGKLSKTEIVLKLRFSKEGKAKNITILGAKKRYYVSLLYKLPLFGYFIKVCVNTLLLPRLITRINANEANNTLRHLGIIQDLEQKVTQTKSDYDALYLAFEDKFRGTREDIKKRQSYYLPMVQEHLYEKKGTLLDIGCGRGEWLELLHDNDIQALGVDMNALMVQTAQKQDLHVIQNDALSFLNSLKDESLQIITAFHIVEHLPFETLITLFDECYRVLKKGGFIIFETPNPENILVGACSFYTDPTHLNPIPPHTLEFLAADRAFRNIQIHRLHPPHEKNECMPEANKEQDYSIIGYKV